jgi:hypothetical protein
VYWVDWQPIKCIYFQSQIINSNFTLPRPDPGMPKEQLFKTSEAFLQHLEQFRYIARTEQETCRLLAQMKKERTGTTTTKDVM